MVTSYLSVNHVNEVLCSYLLLFFSMNSIEDYNNNTIRSKLTEWTKNLLIGYFSHLLCAKALSAERFCNNNSSK